MVTLQTADNALKSFYLDAVSDSLNMKVNPLLAQIKRTTSNVVGKDVRKALRTGISGGITAGTETGNLPTAGETAYTQLVAPLKNLYGTIEITDKALRASANSEGAFVNLLNDEMENLVKSASFNFGRMLFGDGTGTIAKVTGVVSNEISLTSVKGLLEGMTVGFYTASGSAISLGQNRKVLSIDKSKKAITVSGATITETILPVNSLMAIQGSIGNEITGLGAIFSDKEIYGVERNLSAMQPYMKENVGEISENIIQTAIDTIEDNSGSKVNFIVCSWGVRRALAEYFKQFKTMLPTMELEGGFNAMQFNGIPIVADRFCPDGTMYLLNTDDFAIHQLCDWQWLEGEDGKILKQVAGKPVYTATLVKYAELICDRPNGQGMLSGITEA